MQLYCCAFCSECVAADITIELITFQIFFFLLFVMLFHCYTILLFVIQAVQATVDVKGFVSANVHIILLQTLDTQNSVPKHRTRWLKLSAFCSYPVRASFRYRPGSRCIIEGCRCCTQSLKFLCIVMVEHDTNSTLIP